MKPRSIKVVNLNRILGDTSFIENETKQRNIFLCGVKKGNKCRFARHPGRNRQEERYILPRIFLKVSSRRVILEVTSVSRLMSHGHPPGTIRDILERERTCLYVPRPSSSLYIHACTLPLSYHVHTSHAGECRASGNVWVPSTVWWMRRVWRNVIGTDTRGSALTRFSLPSLF